MITQNIEKINLFSTKDIHKKVARQTHFEQISNDKKDSKILVPPIVQNYLRSKIKR